MRVKILVKHMHLRAMQHKFLELTIRQMSISDAVAIIQNIRVSNVEKRKWTIIKLLMGFIAQKKL